jgi:hypothetical protein
MTNDRHVSAKIMNAALKLADRIEKLTEDNKFTLTKQPAPRLSDDPPKL